MGACSCFVEDKQHNWCTRLEPKMLSASCKMQMLLWQGIYIKCVWLAPPFDPSVYNFQCRSPLSRRLSQKLCHMWTSCLAMKLRPRPLLNLKAGNQKTSLKLLERCDAIMVDFYSFVLSDEHSQPALMLHFGFVNGPLTSADCAAATIMSGSKTGCKIAAI